MAATRKIELEIAGTNENVYILRTRNLKTGKVEEAQTFEGEKPLAEKEVGAVLSADFKAQGTRRKAWLTMLGEVFSNPKLDGFIGKGDKEHGKTSKEFRAAVRDAEAEYLRKLVKDGAVKLAISKDENPEEVFQRFATETREDKNYSNVKATVMKYAAFVGSRPLTKSGFLVPVPVMAAEVQRVMDQFKEPADTTLGAKIKALQAELDKKENFPLEEATKALPEAERLFVTIKGIIDHYAELATHHGADIVQLTKDQIEKANAKQEAKGPTKEAKKAPATTD